jgi:transcriptional regulator with XRE-family HTH domain
MVTRNPRRNDTSPEFDFDRILGNDPEVRRAALMAETAAAAGELIRQLRTKKRMSQEELAKRIGSTQAHISELERGLGSNGPTVTTLARIMRELGEELLVETKKQRARWYKMDLAAVAKVSMGEICGRLNTTLQPAAVVATVKELAERATDVAVANPVKKAVTDGFLTGFCMALRYTPYHSTSEIIKAREEIEEIAHLQIDSVSTG